jgi:ribonuclease VapC
VRIVVDTSALVAILLGEPEREAFHRILLASEPVMSVVSLVETFMVAQGRLGASAMVEVDGFLADYRIEIAPVTAADLAELRQGLSAFGKGRAADPAALNFGDLFSYTLAKRLAAPLLFKGKDFAATDVVSAVGRM